MNHMNLMKMKKLISVSGSSVMVIKKTLAENHLSNHSCGDIIKDNVRKKITIGSQEWIEEIAGNFKSSNRRPSFDKNGAVGEKVDEYQRKYGGRLLKAAKEKYGYVEGKGWI